MNGPTLVSGISAGAITARLQPVPPPEDHEGMAGPTLDEVRAWPATVGPATAGTAFGISRSYAYELIRSGQFPAKVIKVGGKNRVVTASILAVLGAGDRDVS